MKKSRLFDLLFAMMYVLFIAQIASATVLQVAADGSAAFASVQPAIDGASSGDTIVVRGDVGTYAGFNINKPLVVIGTGWGCAPTPPTSVTSTITLSSGSTGSVLEGFSVSTNDYYACISVASTQNISIRRCKCTRPTNIPVFINYSSVAVENCAFYGAYYGGVELGTDVTATFANCVLTGQHPISISSGGVMNISVINCFLFGGDLPGAIGSNWTIDHCIFWGSSWSGSMYGNVTASYNVITDVMTNFPGTNNTVISTHPFASFDGSYQPCSSDDLHLSPASGLIDTGDPNAPNDRDNTRRDPGIYGGPNEFVDNGAPEYPFVTFMLVPPSIPQNGPFEIRTSGRVGRGQ